MKQKELIIDNGYEIEYNDKWEDHVYYCDDCGCYHIPIETYSKFNKRPNQTDELIDLIESNQPLTKPPRQ